MKKLIFILCLAFSGCVPAQAEILIPSNYMELKDEWVVSIAISEDGRTRCKVKYKLDFSGNVAIYYGVYVWNNGGWSYASSGSDNEGCYVWWMGSKYYF